MADAVQNGMKSETLDEARQRLRPLARQSVRAQSRPRRVSWPRLVTQCSTSVPSRSTRLVHVGWRCTTSLPSTTKSVLSRKCPTTKRASPRLVVAAVARSARGDEGWRQSQAEGQGRCRKRPSLPTRQSRTWTIGP